MFSISLIPQIKKCTIICNYMSNNILHAFRTFKCLLIRNVCPVLEYFMQFFQIIDYRSKTGLHFKIDTILQNSIYYFKRFLSGIITLSFSLNNWILTSAHLPSSEYPGTNPDHRTPIFYCNWIIISHPHRDFTEIGIKSKVSRFKSIKIIE